MVVINNKTRFLLLETLLFIEEGKESCSWFCCSAFCADHHRGWFSSRKTPKRICCIAKNTTNKRTNLLRKRRPIAEGSLRVRHTNYDSFSLFQYCVVVTIYNSTIVDFLIAFAASCRRSPVTRLRNYL